MAFHRLHRPLRLLRALLLGLFALSLVLQPAMATAGELHELAHDPTGLHAHDLHADELAAEVAAADDDAGQRNAITLHALLHFAHCCGGTAALLPSPQPLAAKPAPARLTVAKTAFPPAARSASPFKPPIPG